MRKLYIVLFALIFAHRYQAQAPTPQLLHYKFNTTGTLVPNYASTPPAGAASATLVGAQTQTGTINCLNALVGTGASSSTDYINTGWTTNLSGPWTVSFWTANNPASTTLWYIWGDNSAGSFRCFTNGVAGTNNWIIRGTGLTDILISGAATVSPNLVTVVYDNVAGKSTTYVNGVQTGTLAQSTSVAFSGTGPFKVGSYGTNSGLGGAQLMADFRLYSSTLTPTEVMDIYMANSTPTLSITGNTIICDGSTTTLTANGASSYTWSNGPTTVTNPVTPSVTTVYTLQGASGSCTAVPVDYTVTVNASPSITIANGSVCNGNSYTLNPAGAATYTFSSGSAVVSPTTTSSYSVTGTSAQGCASSNTAVVTVSVNALPVISVNNGSVCSGSAFTLNPTGAATYTFSNGSAVVSPTTTSSYSVTGTSAQGCASSNTAVATVSVNALPVISVNSGSICSGNTYTLTPSGAATYTFSSGSAVVSPTVTSSYSVTGTSTQGCVGAAIANVTVSPRPTVSAISSASLICVGQSAVITPSGAATYSISGGSYTVSPAVTTSYTITGISAAGCTNTVSFTQNVSPCTGLTSVEGSNYPLQVYPNPSIGVFYISTSGTSKLTVTDILGKPFFTETVADGTHALDLQHMPNGIYFLKSESNGQTKTIRLIKE